MATMTPSSFDPLKRYVNVRLQQGVPIVDADMNELDDVRKFELRAFLKWYVGDGVPEGNDGFRIAAVTTGSPDNDFLVTQGTPAAPVDRPPTETGLRNVGRLVVDGLDVIIDKDIRFTDQPLHETKAGSAALAARWGVPVVSRLTTPNADGQLVVYLDMWERLVTADEAPELVRPGLGVESCARTKREWVVRVRATMPTPADTADHLAGHAYYQLATLVRRNGVAPVATADVVDRRERRLLLPPAHLLADTMGKAAAPSPFDPLAYRRGEDRPAISLRDAINSLLAGRVPTTPDISVSPGAGTDAMRRAVLTDTAGGLIVFWQAPRGTGNADQILGARLDLNRPELGFESKVVATGSTATQRRIEPTAVALPGVGLLVAYQNGSIGSAATDVVMRRASTFADLSTSVTEQTVASTASVADDSPLAVVAGNTVVFFSYQQSGSSQWFYRRYTYAQNSFPDTAPKQLTAASSTPRDLHAAAATNMVWVAHGDGVNVQVLRFDPSPSAANATWTTSMLADTGPSTGGSVFNPFVLPINDNEAMVFYNDQFHTPKGVYAATVVNGVNSADIPRGPIPGTDETETSPAAVRDSEGNIFLFTSRTVPGASGEIVMRRRNVGSSDWTTAQRISPHNMNDLRPHAVFVPGSGIWVFWMSERGQGFDLYAKRVITEI